MSALVVEAVGPLATVQDLGRPGHAALGVTTSGAADRSSLRLANRLVGNDEGAAGVEVLLGRVTLRATGHVRVAVTGAPASVTAAGRAAALCAPLDLRDGERLTVGSPVSGLRTYVAVAGGIAARRLFGSASTDPTSGLGPAPLEVGQRLEVGTSAPHGPTGADVAGPRSPAVGPLTLRVVLGPRDDWFTPEAVCRFLATTWRVTDEADRVGVRLDGPALERRVAAELPSEGVVRGAVQVPASGIPLVFGPDHPTTGGYPVIAVVVDDDTDALAQVRPGGAVRFVVRPASW